MNFFSVSVEEFLLLLVLSFSYEDVLDKCHQETLANSPAGAGLTSDDEDQTEPVGELLLPTEQESISS